MSNLARGGTRSFPLYSSRGDPAAERAKGDMAERYTYNAGARVPARANSVRFIRISMSETHNMRAGNVARIVRALQDRLQTPDRRVSNLNRTGSSSHVILLPTSNSY
jgi:hypothetical protein